MKFNICLLWAFLSQVLDSCNSFAYIYTHTCTLTLTIKAVQSELLCILNSTSMASSTKRARRGKFCVCGYPGLHSCTNTYHVEGIFSAYICRKWGTAGNVDKICAKTSAKFYSYEFVNSMLSALRDILLWNTVSHCHTRRAKTKGRILIRRVSTSERFSCSRRNASDFAYKEKGESYPT